MRPGGAAPSVFEISDNFPMTSNPLAELGTSRFVISLELRHDDDVDQQLLSRPSPDRVVGGWRDTQQYWQASKLASFCHHPLSLQVGNAVSQYAGVNSRSNGYPDSRVRLAAKASKRIHAILTAINAENSQVIAAVGSGSRLLIWRRLHQLDPSQWQAIIAMSRISSGFWQEYCASSIRTLHPPARDDLLDPVAASSPPAITSVHSVSAFSGVLKQRHPASQHHVLALVQLMCHAMLCIVCVVLDFGPGYMGHPVLNGTVSKKHLLDSWSDDIHSWYDLACSVHNTVRLPYSRPGVLARSHRRELCPYQRPLVYLASGGNSVLGPQITSNTGTKYVLWLTEGQPSHVACSSPGCVARPFECSPRCPCHAITSLRTVDVSPFGSVQRASPQDPTSLSHLAPWGLVTTIVWSAIAAELAWCSRRVYSSLSRNRRGHRLICCPVLMVALQTTLAKASVPGNAPDDTPIAPQCPMTNEHHGPTDAAHIALRLFIVTAGACCGIWTFRPAHFHAARQRRSCCCSILSLATFIASMVFYGIHKSGPAYSQWAHTTSCVWLTCWFNYLILKHHQVGNVMTFLWLILVATILASLLFEKTFADHNSGSTGNVIVFVVTEAIQVSPVFATGSSIVFAWLLRTQQNARIEYGDIERG